MNIFASSEDPSISAINLASKWQIKMITESAQILSNALRHHKIEDERLYKKTHINHPCVIWASQSSDNYQWLMQHMTALNREYRSKYGRTHKSMEKFHLFEKYVELLPKNGLTKFANCTRDPKRQLDFRHIENVHFAYDLYVKGKKGILTDQEQSFNQFFMES